jgi:hypothetical protein
MYRHELGNLIIQKTNYLIIMKKLNNKLLLLLILTLLISCFDKRSKINYRFTEKINNNLYLEYYEPEGGGTGIFSGSIRSAYLTDSSKINIFLFAYHQDEGFETIIDSTYFKALKYRLIFQGFNKFSKKQYFDSLIFNLNTYQLDKKSNE